MIERRIYVCLIMATLLLLGTPILGLAQDEDLQKKSEEVRKKIIGLSNFGAFDWISFRVNEDTVILQGYASRPSLKKDAGRTVERIEWVELVDNQVEVLPTSGSDDNIRTRAYGEVYTHPSLSRYAPGGGVTRTQARQTARTIQHWGLDSAMSTRGPHAVHIIVKNGDLTLLGVVRTHSESQIAEMQVSQLSGVFSVTNLIEVPEKD